MNSQLDWSFDIILLLTIHPLLSPNHTFIPEQITVNVHPALFEGEGEGGGGGEGQKKWGTLLFQFTIDIHIQITQKTQKTPENA